MLDRFLAYPAKYHALETVMRMHSVKRWHMIDTTRQQTMAEHSANVAMLAFLIVHTAPFEKFQGGMPAMMWGMFHDLQESFTGDLPGHTKKFLTGLKEVEKAVTPPEFNHHVGVHTQAVVKLCDLADGIRFIRLHGVDATAHHAQKQIEEQLEEKFISVRKDLGWEDNLIEHVQDYIMFYAYESARA